jgi:hypothetical protein
VSFGDGNFGSDISTNSWRERITQASNLWRRILLKTWNCRDFKEFGVNGRDSGKLKLTYIPSVSSEPSY